MDSSAQSSPLHPSTTNQIDMQSSSIQHFHPSCRHSHLSPQMLRDRSSRHRLLVSPPLMPNPIRKISPELYSGHSFRIGAASTASRQGIPDQTKKILGCWSPPPPPVSHVHSSRLEQYQKRPCTPFCLKFFSF